MAARTTTTRAKHAPSTNAPEAKNADATSEAPEVSTGAPETVQPTVGDVVPTAEQADDVKAALGDTPTKFDAEQAQGYLGDKPDVDEAIAALKHSGRIPV